MKTLPHYQSREEEGIGKFGYLEISTGDTLCSCTE